MHGPDQIFLTHSYPRRSHRVVDRDILSHISNMNFQFWAVLGSRGCREKKIQTAISMILLRAVFFMFSWAILFPNFLKIIVTSALKSYKRWKKGIFLFWFKIGYLWNLKCQKFLSNWSTHWMNQFEICAILIKNCYKYLFYKAQKKL